MGRGEEGGGGRGEKGGGREKGGGGRAKLKGDLKRKRGKTLLFSQTDKKITRRDVKCVCNRKNNEEHVMDATRS